MRIVISGGSGLIGGALASALAAEGHELVVLSRRPEAVRGLPYRARAVAWDGRSTGGWAGEVDGAGAVVHLAGENIAAGRWTEARKEALRASRVESGAVMTAAVEAATNRPEVFVQASAVGYYGPRGDEEVTEAAPPGSDFLGRLAAEWEASTARVEALGVRRVVIRTGVVLDPGGGALAKLLPPFRLGGGGPMGDGNQWFPWIHRDDEVGAIRFLIGEPQAHGPFNLTAPEPVRNRELARTLGHVLRRPAFLPLPGAALRLALGEMSEVLLTGQRAVPARLVEVGYRFRFPTLAAALRHLLA